MKEHLLNEQVAMRTSSNSIDPTVAEVPLDTRGVQEHLTDDGID